MTVYTIFRLENCDTNQKDSNQNYKEETPMECISKKERMILTDLKSFLNSLPIGTIVPGLQKSKNYRFAGLEPYPSRGRFARLAGKMVAVLESDELKRKRIILFLNPLLMLVNGPTDNLDYGRRPLCDYAVNGGRDEYPNIYQYETHYKALAKYVKIRMLN